MCFFIIALFFRFNDKSQPFIDQGWLVSCNINDLEQWNDKEFPSHHCNKIHFVCLITENSYACRLRNLVMAIKVENERVRELLNIERFLLWLNDYGFSAQVHALFTCFIGMRNQSPEIQCLTIEDWVHNDIWKNLEQWISRESKQVLGRFRTLSAFQPDDDPNWTKK